MAGYSGPEIANSGLVLHLDAANYKNFSLTSVEVLVVAGGGGGGSHHGGGGGGGGVIYNTAFTVIPGTAYTVTVGNGGTGGPSSGTNGTNGGNSVFGSLTAIGGGGGGSYSNGGGSGGSGGGPTNWSVGAAGGSGTANQGTSAYNNNGTTNYGGGGGGAASRPKGLYLNNGGDGFFCAISGTPSYFGGGGGSGTYPGYSQYESPPTGGLGGGGTGGNGPHGGGTAPTAGTANTGGGGGGVADMYQSGAAGGSGIVIVRYQGPQRAIGGTVTTSGKYTIHTFTTVGSTTFTPMTTSTLTGLADLSGNNNFGTPVNGPTYSSANGGSIVFDGINDYVDFSTNLGILSNYTIMFWARRDAENKMPIAGRTGLAFYWYGDNSWAYTHGGTRGEYYYSKPTSISLGTWGHYCVVYDGANVNIYRQGVYQGQKATTGTADWTSGLMIGYWQAQGWPSYAWQGMISTVTMYNRALTATEILQSFEATRSRFGI